MTRVFSQAWFARWQWFLLLLLDEPLIGRWLRWVLCIRRHDVGYRQRIVLLLPHAYVVDNGDGTWTGDFRTHAKYAKRLYYAFRPIWWLLHAWDLTIANRFVPALNCGFDTLTVSPDPNPEVTSVDGRVSRDSVDESWASLIAGGGSGIDDSFHLMQAFEWANSATTNQFVALHRGIVLFDTSALTSGATLSAATLSVFGNNKNDPWSVSPTLDVYTSTPAANTSLANGDFSQIGTSSQTGAPIAYTSLSVVAYTDLVFSTLANISKTGVSKFGLRNANYDVAAVQPTWGSGGTTTFTIHAADETGSSQDPKLVVTYSLAGGAHPSTLTMVGVQ